jgi:hypothetical protein
MDAGHIIVLVLSVGVIVFLVFIEINSRRNEARLKAEAGAKPGASAPAQAGAQAKSRAV